MEAQEIDAAACEMWAQRMVTHKRTVSRAKKRRAKTWTLNWELVHKARESQGVSRERTFICGSPAQSPSPAWQLSFLAITV